MERVRPRNTLTRLRLRGFKSIKDSGDLALSRLNVLIGPNGAGKSNLIAFFRLLSHMTQSPGKLQDHVAQTGGANALLHDGAAITPKMGADLTFETEVGENDYAFTLFHGAPDRLIFAEEKYRYSRRGFVGRPPDWMSLGSSHLEANISQKAEEGDTTAQVIRTLMRRCIVHQFHNTSGTANIRQKCVQDDNRYLREDGANLASFLLRLQENEPAYYRRILQTLRQIAPFFADFELEPEYGYLLLRWRESESDLVFGPHQASDGTLRVMALLALLLQPENNLPDVLILDEPELGLHPYALNVVAGLLKSVSTHTQVIVATQSAALVDYFAPEDIIVVDRRDRESVFRRLESESLKEWLGEYSLGELWEKNVIGGRPA